MRRLKECPYGSASTRWDYPGLMSNLYHLGWRYQDADPKRCYYSQTSCVESPLNPFWKWCSMLLTVLHHSPIVSIPLLLPSNPSILLLFFPPCEHELRAITIIIIFPNETNIIIHYYHHLQGCVLWQDFLSAAEGSNLERH